MGCVGGEGAEEPCAIVAAADVVDAAGQLVAVLEADGLVDPPMYDPLPVVCPHRCPASAAACCQVVKATFLLLIDLVALLNGAAVGSECQLPCRTNLFLSQRAEDGGW